jgi:lipopolysaccharide transport system ATP-binding protein
MGDLSKGEGRTVLFVSHNMDSVSNLCNKGILLNFGEIISNGSIEDSVSEYLNQGSLNIKEVIFNTCEKIDRSGAMIFGELLNIKTKNSRNILTDQFFMFEDLFIELELNIKTNCPKPEIGIAISNTKGQRFHHFVSTWENDWENWQIGKVSLRTEILNLEFYPGIYTISIWFRPYTTAPSDDFIESAINIEIIQNTILKKHQFHDFSKSGGVYKKSNWLVEKI